MSELKPDSEKKEERLSDKEKVNTEKINAEELNAEEPNAEELNAEEPNAEEPGRETDRGCHPCVRSGRQDGVRYLHRQYVEPCQIRENSGAICRIVTTANS